MIRKPLSLVVTRATGTIVLINQLWLGKTGHVGVHKIWLLFQIFMNHNFFANPDWPWNFPPLMGYIIQVTECKYSLPELRNDLYLGTLGMTHNHLELSNSLYLYVTMHWKMMQWLSCYSAQKLSLLQLKHFC